MVDRGRRIYDTKPGGALNQSGELTRMREVLGNLEEYNAQLTVIVVLVVKEQVRPRHKRDVYENDVENDAQMHGHVGRLRIPCFHFLHRVGGTMDTSQESFRVIMAKKETKSI